MLIRLEEAPVLLGLPQLSQAGQVKGSWAEASLAILQCLAGRGVWQDAHTLPGHTWLKVRADAFSLPEANLQVLLYFSSLSPRLRCPGGKERACSSSLPLASHSGLHLLPWPPCHQGQKHAPTTTNAQC